jgi:RHS repeat-associated protein
LNEQLHYAFDPAGNLAYRTNNALVANFRVNSVNELTSNTNGGTLTVVGTTTSPANSVTVNSTSASLYGDATFAASGLPLTTTYTAAASDSYGRHSTNTVTVSLSTNVTFQYDGNGNLTNDGLRNFVYDDENELIQVSVSNSWMSQFSYDGKMRRRIRQEYAWQSGSWVQTNQVYYVYDGNLVIQERNANNLPMVTYTRDLDLSGNLEGAGLPRQSAATAGGIGGLLARTDQVNTTAAYAKSFYHCDGNGNVTMLVDSHQGIAATYLYDAFGNTISKSGMLADGNVYRFSSKEWHQNSGLVYYLYRYYDPNLQRWLNRDPIQEAGGINLYGFVGNNPINFVDPYGLAPWYSWLNPFSYSSGYAQYQGQQALQSQLNAAGYGSPQEFQLANPTWNGNGSTQTAGDAGATQAAGSVAQDAANLYLTAATAVTPTAAGMNVGLDALSQAASALDRGGFTKAGRSLTKHCVGARPGNALFPAVSGDAAAINKQAQAIVDGILTDPGTVFQNSYRGRFGNTLEATAPNGQGVVFDANGNFLFFKE